MTMTWVDTDGEHILINTVQGSQKARNVARDPRVTVGVCHRDQPHRYWEIRGRVIATDTSPAARRHIDTLARRYLDAAYPGFTGGNEKRVILIIAAATINQPVDRRPARQPNS